MSRLLAPTSQNGMRHAERERSIWSSLTHGWLLTRDSSPAGSEWQFSDCWRL